MRVGLTYRGFRTNFRIVCKREVQLLKVDKLKFVDKCFILHKINYNYRFVIIFNRFQNN